MWKFIPSCQISDHIQGGEIVGEVPETSAFIHRILCPPDIEGEIREIALEGEYTIEHTIAKVQTTEGERELKMYQRWPVRHPRPYKQRLNPTVPLVTGQRVIDTFFPFV